MEVIGTPATIAESTADNYQCLFLDDIETVNLCCEGVSLPLFFASGVRTDESRSRRGLEKIVP
jgi:hypothetical protein